MPERPSIHPPNNARSLTDARVWTYANTVADPHLNPVDDGSGVYVEANRGGSAQLKWFRPGCVPVVLPCSPDIRSVSASGGGVVDWIDSGSVVYVGGGGLHRLDLETMDCRPLNIVGEGVTNVAVSPDGHLVAYVADMQHVYVSSTDPEVDETRKVSSGNDFAVDPAWSPDSRTVVWHEWDDPQMAWTASRIVSRDIDGGPVATVVDDACFVSQPRYREDATVCYLSDVDGWPVPVSSAAGALVSGADARHEYCEPTWGAGQRSWQPMGSGTVACRTNKGFGEVVFVRGGGEVEVLENATATGLHAPRGGSHVAMIVAGPNRPTQLIVVNVDTAARVVVAQSSPHQLETKCVVPEAVSWSSSDGMEIHGRFYKPRGWDPRNAPMLVWIHGGPTHRSDTTILPRVGYFVERDFSVLVPDYRGSSGWGRAYREAGYGEHGRGDLDDVVSGVRAALERGWVEQGRVVPFGGSAGGMLTLLAMSTYPELFAAGVVQYPVCDLLGFGEDTWRFEAHYLDTLIGVGPDANQRKLERSPLTHAASISAPLLMMHGTNDAVVPLSQSQAFAKAASAGGANVRLEVFEGEGHGWRAEASKPKELTLMEDFLRTVKIWPGQDSQSIESE